MATAGTMTRRWFRVSMVRRLRCGGGRQVGGRDCVAFHQIAAQLLDQVKGFFAVGVWSWLRLLGAELRFG